MSRDASNAMDISATLDELLKDDEMFNELQDLPLNVGTQSGQCESQDLSSFDLSFLFSDLNEDITEGVWSIEPSDLATPSQYIQPISSDSVSRECEPQPASSGACELFVGVNQWVGEEAQNVCKRVATSSLSEAPCTTEQPESSSLVVVQHDHSYAKSPHSEEDTEEKDVMEVEEGSDSAEDSSSSHDAGYETMSASMSPDNKSSPPPLSSTSLSLLPDPVKLIDERIKFFMSTQQVSLSTEEKETLIAEGLPVPTTLPLTKIEEKALKSVRRKIRNKVAAQESRKKKKEYIDCLEERVKRCSEKNHHLQRKVDNLETENRTLLQQLQQLQALVARTNPIFRPMQLGSCLMVVVLCFAILFGNMLPYKVTLSSSTEYTSTATVRSRALLSLDTPHYHGWVDYYKSLLLGEDTQTWSTLSSNMADQAEADEYSKAELDTNKTNEPHPQLITPR